MWKEHNLCHKKFSYIKGFIKRVKRAQLPTPFYFSAFPLKALTALFRELSLSLPILPAVCTPNPGSSSKLVRTVLLSLSLSLSTTLKSDQQEERDNWLVLFIHTHSPCLPSRHYELLKSKDLRNQKEILTWSTWCPFSLWSGNLWDVSFFLPLALDHRHPLKP